MSHVNRLLSNIKEVHKLYKLQKAAEKAKVEQIRNEALKTFQKCYSEFKEYQVITNTAAVTSNNHDEVIILLAEAAFYTNQIPIARELVEYYLQNEPSKNQFFVRSKILLALIIDNENALLHGIHSINQRKVAMKELSIALEIILQPSNVARYGFLLYNLSLVGWKIVRQFLRKDHSKYFITEFQSILQAIEQQHIVNLLPPELPSSSMAVAMDSLSLDEESDIFKLVEEMKEWKIWLYVVATTCMEDDKSAKSNTALENIEKAIAIMEELYNITQQFETKQTKTLQTYQQEVDVLMNAFRAIEDRQELMAKPIKIDPDIPLDDEYYTKPREYPPLEGLAGEGHAKVKEKLDIVQEKKAIVEAKFRRLLTKKGLQREHLIKLYSYRVMLNPADAKRFLGANSNITKDIRMNTLVTLQCIVSNAITGEKDIESTVQQLMKKLETFTPANEMRNETLLDVARFCWTNRQLPLAKQCMEILQATPLNMTKMIRIKLDMCESLKNFYEIDSNLITKANAQLLSKKQIEGIKLSQRLDSIKLLERVLIMCNTADFEDKYLILDICAIGWNFLIPFCTKKLRMKVHSTLRIMATILENIQANYLLPLLQSNVHYELGLCEEALDYVGMAKTEIEKALYQDYGEVKVLETKGEKGIPAGTFLQNDRLNDEYLVPLLRGLELRVDVYSTPSTVDAQVVLWLQQAKESTSKSTVRDLITKCAVLLFEDTANSKDPSPTTETIYEEAVDYSMVLLKRGALQIPEMTLQELQSIFTSEETAPIPETFTYAKQQRFRNLFTLIQLASHVQDVNIIQQAGFYILKQHYSSQDFFAGEFLDAQIEVCSLFAESTAIRLQLEGKKYMQSLLASSRRSTASLPKVTKSQSLLTKENDMKRAQQLSLGIESTDLPEDIMEWKKLIIASFMKGYKLAMTQKDIYAVQNNLIYFWNLHVHVFRNQLFNNLQEDVFEYLKYTVSTFEAVMGFPHAATVCDVKLFVQIIDGLVSVYESKQLFIEAAELAMKGGMTFVFPAMPLNSCEGSYYRKGLIEKAAKRNVLNALNGVNAVPTGGKGGGKGGAPPPLEVITIPDNPLLTVYANLAIAEFYPADTLPAALLSDSLAKAIALLQNDVQTFITSEVEKETNGTALRTKERAYQRVEMQLECYSRLSRLKILYSDYVNGQYLAQNGLQVFGKLHSEELRSSNPDSVGFEPEDEGDDGDSLSMTATIAKEDDSFGKEYEPYGSHILRYLSTCEQMMALALMSFIEANSSVDTLAGNEEGSEEAGGVTVLDPELIAQLQYISVEHLESAITYAIVSKEELLLQDYLTLAYSLLQTLLPLDPTQANPIYFPKAYKLALKIIAVLMQCKKYLKTLVVDTQVLWRNFYLLLINLLVFRKEYPLATQLNAQAFEQITNTDLQKELWPSKVICMSKKGLNVLDGLQKLKEKDVLLQAQVLILFARSTKDLSSKIATYQQALGLLENRMEYLEYLFELIEILTEKGIPRMEIQSVLALGLDFCYQIEENEYEEIVSWELDDAVEDEDEMVVQSRVGGTVPGGTSDRRQSIASKGRTSGGGGATSAVPSRLGASTRGASVGGYGGGSRRASVTGKSRAASRIGSSVKGGTTVGKKSTGGGREDGEKEEVRPSTLDQKAYEQLMRLLIMSSQLELSHEKKLAISFQVLFYIQKNWQSWIKVLQEEYRADSYIRLSDPEKEGTPYEKYVVSSFPGHLTLPTTRLAYLGWSNQPVLRNSLLKTAVSRPQDLPSLTSFPTFAMTCYHLANLIIYFQQTGFYDLCIFVVAYLRMLLWTVPLALGSENDRLVVLTWCQLITTQLQYQMGSPILADLDCFILDTTGAADETKDSEAATKYLTPGKIINQFITSLTTRYYQHDISPAMLLDLSYADLFRVIQSGDESSVSSNTLALSFPPFGIHTTTLTFPSYQNLDQIFYWLKCLPVLVSLGQQSVAEHLTIGLLYDQRTKQHLRYFNELTAYYHSFLATKGLVQDAIARILAQKLLWSNVTDCRLVGYHVHVLVESYLRNQLYEESRQTLGVLLTMLQDHAIRMISKPRNSSSTTAATGATGGALPTVTMGLPALANHQDISINQINGGTASKMTLLRSASAGQQYVSSATIMTAKTAGGDYIVMEIGYEYLHTLKQLVVDHVRYLLHYNLSKLQELALNATSSVSVAAVATSAVTFSSAGTSNAFDPIQSYRDYCEQFTKYIDLFEEVGGEERNEWALELRTLRCQGASQCLIYLHKFVSRLLAGEVYTSWWQDNLAMCVDYAQQVYLARKAWYEQYLTSSLFETTSLLARDNPLVLQQVTAISPFPETGYQFTQGDFPQVFPHQQVQLIPPNVHEISFGLAHLQLATMQWKYLVATQQHTQHSRSSPAPTSDSPNILNAVEKYMEDTKPLENTLSLNHFRSSLLDHLLHLSASSAHLLRLTRYSLRATLLYYLAQVTLAIRQNKFSSSWHWPTSIQTGNKAEVPKDVLAWREMLETTIKQVLSPVPPAHIIGADNEEVLELVASGCLVLMESYGCQEATKAIFWLTTFQSLQSRKVLQSLWQSALNKKTDISAALQRMEALAAQQYPNFETLPSYQADKAFLSSASAAYRRLRVVVDEGNTWQVVDNVCTSQCLYLIVQFDPYHNVLYLGAGRPATAAAAPPAKAPPASAKNVPAPAPAESKPADASWLFDKVTLTETQRRRLQVLQEQHRLWQQDVTKFVAVSSDNLAVDDDLDIINAVPVTTENSPHHATSANFPVLTATQKAERALEERLRALLADLDALFDEWLGSESRLYQHLAQYIATTATAVVAPAASSPATLGVKWNLVMLLDATLHNLPWEGLKLAQTIFTGQMSRDYSLQFLQHRCQATSAPVTPAGTAAATTPPAVSTTTVASTTIKFVVDPLQEDSGSKLPGKERKPLAESASAVVAELSGGQKWQRLRGNKGVLSAEDFILAFHSTALPSFAANTVTPPAAPAANTFNSFVSLTLGRFAHFLGPQDLCTANLEKTLLWYSFDQAYNDPSYRRLNSTDVLKKSADVELEQPMHMIALLGLAGVISQVHNAWSVPISSQQRYFNMLFKSFTNLTKKEKLMFSLQEGEQVLCTKNNSRLKRWVKLARVMYGVPSLSYSDA